MSETVVILTPEQEWAGARSIYESEREVSPVKQHWPEWRDLDSSTRVMFITRLRRAAHAMGFNDSLMGDGR